MLKRWNTSRHKYAKLGTNKINYSVVHKKGVNLLLTPFFYAVSIKN